MALTLSRIHVPVLWLAAVSAHAAPLQQGEIPTFGTTVVIPSGLSGRIYAIREGTPYLPNFRSLRPIGTIYTSSLAIWPRSFVTGFPGVTDRFEWFAIDYTGRFWIEKPGRYRFSLLSDDGSKLYIDERAVINNDGQHATLTEYGSVVLGCGIHSIRLSYFQGPRFEVALVLSVAGPGEKMRIFNTDEFLPPPNPEDWDSCDAQGSKGRALPNRRSLRGALEGKPEPDPAAAPAAPALRRTLGDAMKERLESNAAAVLSAPPQPQPFAFRTAAYHFRRDGDNSRSVLAFEVPGASLTATPAPDGKTHRVHVFLFARIRDAGGVVIDKFSRDIPYEVPAAKLAALRASPAVYTQPVLLPPGRYRIETAVWDGEGDRWSSGVIDVDSPGGKGLGLSSIVLVRQVEASDGPADYADPLVFQGKRFIPILPATLPYGLAPTAYFIVYRNRENPDAPRIRVELLAGGKVLAEQTGELPPPDESYAIPMLVALAGRQGDCEVRITVMQGSESVTRNIRYSIAPQ